MRPLLKRIALFGGTFNPIHIGHLVMAQMAQEKFDLDKIIFVPSYLPPHKQAHSLAAAKHRYRMVERCIQGHPQFGVSDYEIKKKGKSFTIDTVQHIFSRYQKEAKLFFIIGEDSLRQLPQWHKIQDILKMVTFLVVNRPGYQHRRDGGKYRTVAMPGLDLSSSYLRGRVKAGKSIKYLVPEEVIRYIEKHQLYK